MNSLSRKLSDTLRSHLVTSRTLLTASVSCAAVLASWQAHSEDAQADPRGAGSTRSTVAGDHVARIETVIVTARKREENLQDVPISIAAIDADAIARRGLVGADDYLRGVPGVNQTDQVTGQTIVIRGLETSPAAQNFGAGNTVATYFGETPTTSSAGLVNDTNVDIRLVDIERVEVLRGPQGTSYGSSSLGGAVRTIPVAPKLDRFEGKAGVGYSATADNGGDNYMLQAVANIPLIKDKLAVRAVGYKFQDGGFYRNDARTDQLLATAVIQRYGAPDAAVSSEEAGTVEVRGARVAAALQATDDLKLTVSYLNQKREMDGFGLANRPGYLQALPLVAPEHEIRGSREPRSDTRIEITNATLEYAFERADLLATYSYVDSGATRSFPFVGFNFLYPASNIGASPHKERSGEIRLVTHFDAPWNLLTGFYWEKLEDHFTRTDYWHGDPALNPFAPNQRYLGQFSDNREKEQKAAFGEISWEFLPNWTLTGGARYYEHDREYDRTNDGPFYGNIPVSSTASVSGSNFRGNLSFRPAEGKLIYLDYSEGFRLGNAQAGLAAGRCDANGDGIVDGTGGTTIASTRELDPDSLDSLELGAKLGFLDGRLVTSLSVFHIEWDGPPFRVIAPLPPSGCGLSYVANASKAESNGVEFQANFQITPAFRADIGASVLRAELTEDAPSVVVGGVGAVDGDRLPGAPRFNSSLALQYEFTLRGFDAYVRADSIYVGEYYDTIKPLPNFKAGDYIKVDLATRMMVSEALSVELYARNLTNSDDFTFRDVGDYGPFFGYRLRPRTIGLQIGYSF